MNLSRICLKFQTTKTALAKPPKAVFGWPNKINFHATHPHVCPPPLCTNPNWYTYPHQDLPTWGTSPAPTPVDKLLGIADSLDFVCAGRTSYAVVLSHSSQVKAAISLPYSAFVLQQYLSAAPFQHQSLINDTDNFWMKPAHTYAMLYNPACVWYCSQLSGWSNNHYCYSIPDKHDDVQTKQNCIVLIENEGHLLGPKWSPQSMSTRSVLHSGKEQNQTLIFCQNHLQTKKVLVCNPLPTKDPHTRKLKTTVSGAHQHILTCLKLLEQGVVFVGVTIEITQYIWKHTWYEYLQNLRKLSQLRFWLLVRPE